MFNPPFFGGRHYSPPLTQEKAPAAASTRARDSDAVPLSGQAHRHADA